MQRRIVKVLMASVSRIQQVTGAKPQKVADDVVHYASCVLERC